MNQILVTGGMGFIGSCFIRRTIEKFPKCNVINYDSLTYAGNLLNLTDISDNPNYTFVKGDICDRSSVSDLISSSKFDKIVNQID